MMALAYRDLPDIDSVEPLGEADFECLEAVREVLARHDRLDRFGITLMHGHFPLGEDEVLVESCDDEARILTMKVEPAEILAGGNLVQTSWRLSDGVALATCRTACVFANGSHQRNKHVVSR